MKLRLASRWRLPIFGVWGSEDFGYRQQWDKLLAVTDSLPLQERVFVESAGHWLQYEKNEEFDGLTRRILGGS